MEGSPVLLNREKEKEEKANANAILSLSSEGNVQEQVNSSLIFFTAEERNHIEDSREELELIERCKAGDEKAGDEKAERRLFGAHFGLICKLARPFAKSNEDLKKDLIQAGMIGLKKAIDKFKPEKGFRLNTSAVWWIKAEMQEFVRREVRLIKVSVDWQNRIFAIVKFLREEKGIPDPPSEVIVEMFLEGEANVLFERVEQVEMAVATVLGRHPSLDRPLYDDSGATWVETVPSGKGSPEEILEERQTKERKLQILKEALDSCLTERERAIYLARNAIGTEDGESVSLENLAQKHGITRERIRQIQVIATRKIERFFKRSEVKARLVA